MMLLALVLVSMLSCTNTVICDDYGGSTSGAHGAIINITYHDHTGTARFELDTGGHYGASSRVEDTWGRVVHVRTVDGPGPGCFPPVNIPGWRWIALVDRASCRGDLRIHGLTSIRNASAVVMYNGDHQEESDTDGIEVKKQKGDDVVYVYIGSQRGEQIAALVDNGTRVTMYLTVGGRTNQVPYNAINKTSMLFLSISFIVLMIISLAWLIFYYVQRSRYTYAKQRLSRRLMSAAKKAITKMPLRTVHNGEEIETGFDLCAICIEGYKTSEVVRILPCKHVFHKSCIDPWLIEHRSCPICKIDILKAFGMQIYRSRDSTMNIEAEVASTSFGYSEYVPPDGARDFDSDGVEIVRFQLAQIEYHSANSSGRPPAGGDADSETGASDELSSYDHLLENESPEMVRTELPPPLPDGDGTSEDSAFRVSSSGVPERIGSLGSADAETRSLVTKTKGVPDS